MEEIQTTISNLEVKKRKNSIWSVLLPILHLIIVANLSLAAVGCWDSTACAEKVKSAETFIKYLMIISGVFSIILYNRSKNGKGRRYGIISLISGLIIPLLAMWLLLN